MDETDERTSLVRSNGPSSGVASYNNNSGSGFNAGNWRPHLNGNSRPRTPATAGQDGPGRRDPRTLLTQVQRSLGFFQEWAVNLIHGQEDSAVVSWVQNARVARTFMMIINVLLAVSAFVLIGVETLEMVVREPILDYLLPESEITLLAAGLTIVVGAFGFSVAYNLLVEENPPRKNDNGDDHRGGDSGRNGDQGPRAPLPSNSTSPILGQNGDASVIIQQTTRRPRIMFTKASTYLLNGYTVLLVLTLIVFTMTIAQRSGHLNHSNEELNEAWRKAYKKPDSVLIRDFELHHQCCGYNHISDRAYPRDDPQDKDPEKAIPCKTNPKFSFDVPCRVALKQDYWRWQNGIQHLLIVQVTMLLPLLLLVMGLSVVGLSKLKKKEQGFNDAEEQEEASATVPGPATREGYAFERPLLEDVPNRARESPFLLDVSAEPIRVTSEIPVEQDSHQVWT